VLLLNSKKQVVLRRDSRIPIIEISGTVSGSIAGDLMAAYEKACESQPQNIIVKFVAGDHLYSSGISVLIKLLAEAGKRGQKVHATGLSRHFAHIFSITGLNKHIQVFPSEEEALASLE
jgi:anti-sigma B factor antagonist